GADEVDAFAHLPDFAASTTDRLCRLVLLGVLPSLVERDLDCFGQAIEEMQVLVGRTFAAAQRGRLYARVESATIVERMRAVGLRGVGQSSGGPALYGFSALAAGPRESLLHDLQRRLELPEGTIFWAGPSSSGAYVRTLD